MTKSILLTVSPTEALNVLNGKQSALLRKRVPKGYVGWCYGVVSKKGIDYMRFPITFAKQYGGKIPFRFWHEEVETYYLERPLNLEITYRGIDNQQGCEYSKDIKKELLKKTNLTFSELFDLGHKRSDGQQSVFNLISITKLDIFDKPMELEQFRNIGTSTFQGKKLNHVWKEVTKSPSTYQYVWVKE